MENGQKQIEVYVLRFQELALFMAENARVLFNEELPKFITENDGTFQLTPLITDAKQSLEEFITYLKEEYPLNPWVILPWVQKPII